MSRSPTVRSFEYWLHSSRHAWRPALLSSVATAMLATPLGVRDVLQGHLLWILFRVGTSCAIFAAVMAAFEAFDSPWAALAPPAAVLTGMALAAPIAAFAITQDRDLGFAALSRFVIVPMFLFSGTVFPIEELPRALELIAYVTPLWHGVDLARELSLGEAAVGSALLHTGYLCLWVLAGTAVARVTFRRRLRV